MSYMPEIGQMAFGQPWQPLEPTPSMAGALQAMAELWSVMRDEDSPFANTGNRYDGKMFKAHAYSWNEYEQQEFNFAWRDVRISWYKHQARGTSANRQMSDEEVRQMLRECLPEIVSASQSSQATETA